MRFLTATRLEKAKAFLGAFLLVMATIYTVPLRAQTTINIPVCSNCGTTGTTFVANTSGCFKTKMVQVSTGDFESMGVSVDGDVYVWGDGSQAPANEIYMLNSEFPVPTKLLLATGKAIKVQSGDRAQGAITSTGELYMWGSNLSGELPGGIILDVPSGTPAPSVNDRPYSTTFAAAPVAVPSPVVDFAMGYSGSCTIIVTQDGNAYVIGDSRVGYVNGNYSTWAQIPSIAGSQYTRVWEFQVASLLMGAIFEVRNTSTGVYSYYASGSNFTGALRTGSGPLKLDQQPVLMNLAPLTGKVQDILIDGGGGGSYIIKMSNTDYYYCGANPGGANTTPVIGTINTSIPQKIKMPPGAAQIYDFALCSSIGKNITIGTTGLPNGPGSNVNGGGNWICTTDIGVFYPNLTGTDWLSDTYHLTDGSIRSVFSTHYQGIYYIDVNGFITFSGYAGGTKQYLAAAGLGYDNINAGGTTLQHLCLRTSRNAH